MITSTFRPTVVHILPTDLARGAQVYARAIRDRLDGPRQRHVTLTLFSAPTEGELAPDFCLGVPSGRLRRAGYDPRVLIRLNRWLARHRADVIVVHGGEPLKYVIPARRRGQPVVYYRIGGEARVVRGAHRLLYRYLARRAEVIAAVSEEVAVEAADVLGVSRSRVRVIANGRDPERFVPRRHEGAGEPVLLFVGAAVVEKRPDWFIEAVAALRDRGYRFRARLLGDGPLLHELAPRAAEAGVCLLGARRDVPEILSSADVLAFPSAAREGVAGVLMEAGLAGLPVVATDARGVRSVLVDGETGLIVGLDDFEGFVDALAVLVTDPARRQHLGRAARRRCLEHFTLDSATVRWRDLLALLLADAPPAET